VFSGDVVMEEKMVSLEDLFRGFESRVVTERLRIILKGRIGPVVSGDAFFEEVKKPGSLITVGDVVTCDCVEAGRVPDIAIVDLKTRRKESRPGPPRERWDTVTSITNPPGCISSRAVEEIKKVIDNVFNKKKGKTLIVVDGEEDLLSLVAIAAAPDGTRVIYGLPDVGATVVEVTPPTRKKALLAIESMEEERDGD